MGILDLEGHLIFYRSYHFNQVNVGIHLCCIPIILFSTLAFLSPVNILGKEYPYANLGSALAWSYGIYYSFLDWKLGIPSMALLGTLAYVFKTIYMNLSEVSAITQKEFVQYAIALHVLSWLAQFYGHGVHEKRAPALLDNLLQAIVLAPFFVSFEIAFWLGYKLDLKKRMDNGAGKKIMEIKQKEAAAQMLTS
ncbi:uncharacterized protein AC631_01217 [Debaryomyces fabryi]|uniref:Endoplasmic reticulum membrane protein n=1 Tax=Debaryomyces fabryi TaxID=58627 RepID=A0A0V1Q3G5_9ASCO|nr:uncharacterized protein AC631_01217 [Debaryomyces fabryi]KSA03083.1 hypothetical protein AC631_01217 [Debaryomyces fabryi]CUM49080.1 unnamed protein product [Debaryomyces fabryi]